MTTALSRSHRQEGLRGPGGTGVQPGGKGESLRTLSHCNFYEVSILCFDVRFQVLRMADDLSRRSSSATLPSPSPLTPFHPIVPREVHIGVKCI